MVSCKCIWRNYTSIEISLFQLFELNYGGSEGKIRNWFWYDISMTWCREHKYCAHIVLENNSVNYLFKNGKQLTLQLLPSWHLNTVGTYVQQGPIKGEIKSPQYNCEPLVLTGFKCSGSTPIKMGWSPSFLRVTAGSALETSGSKLWILLIFLLVISTLVAPAGNVPLTVIWGM